MPITQSLNSKANVKKSTTNDLPFAPQQPVINSFYAVSTAGQTVIALSFSVDTVNLSDQFFLFIDGKKMRLGSSNDYTFTAIGANGYSSQVTLTQAIPISLNIQAYMLGLKKESEFNMDNRFVQLYAAQGSGFQGFVDTSQSLTATTTTGTPAAGTFYSSIIKRTSSVDITQDLRASLGIERIMTQQISQIQGESGPNGEPVFGVLNDDRGLVRFVGTWASAIDTNGIRPNSNVVGDYLEITFFGTGLNFLSRADGTSRTWTPSVDGVATTAVTQAGSNVLNARNYSPNVVIQAVIGLTLGVHTVKIALTTGPSFEVYGLEVINASSTIIVNPGIGYSNGQKLALANASSQVHNAGFETGTLTTAKGGHVLVYQKSDGTIGKAITSNATQLNLTATDHTNEELVRQYHWREFGSGQSTDFSTLSGLGSNVALAFTLDDDTTTLTGNAIAEENNQLAFNTNGAFAVVTFVGTGLDIFRQDNASGGSDTYSVTVDGTSIGNLASTGSTTYRREKVVSGLAYATHTVKFTRVTAATYRMRLDKFLVYQPKKPTLPSGAVELADYNVMATYSANATANPLFLGTGVLRKFASREATYLGTWVNGGIDTNTFGSGIAWLTTTSGSSVSFTFFGNAFDFRFFLNNTVAHNLTFALDGSTNFTGLTLNAALATGLTFTTATGVLSGTPTGGIGGNGLSVAGLALGVHTIKVTSNTVNQFYPDSLDAVTLIHSAKSNIYGDLQNTLPVGSQTISDNRKITPVKDLLPNQKAWAQAIGIINTPTTSSTASVPISDMSVTIKTNGGPIRISYAATVTNNTASANIALQVFVDGVAVGTTKLGTAAGAGANVETVTDIIKVPVSTGAHKVDLYWSVSSGIGNSTSIFRTLLVEET